MEIMGNILQIVGGILVSGLLTGIFLVVLWGLVFFVMLKARNTYHHFRHNKMKHTLVT
jgi:hypothetical protein